MKIICTDEADAGYVQHVNEVRYGDASTQIHLIETPGTKGEITIDFDAEGRILGVHLTRPWTNRPSRPPIFDADIAVLPVDFEESAADGTSPAPMASIRQGAHCAVVEAETFRWPTQGTACSRINRCFDLRWGVRSALAPKIG